MRRSIPMWRGATARLPRKLTDAEAKQAPPLPATFRATGGSPFSRAMGDLFLYDSTNGQVRQITNTSEAETDPHFLPDGKRIYFTRGGNLYRHVARRPATWSR